MFPSAVIFEKLLRIQGFGFLETCGESKGFFPPSLLKLLHIYHSWFQKQLIVDTQRMKSKSFTYLYILHFSYRIVTLIRRSYKCISSLQLFVRIFFPKAIYIWSLNKSGFSCEGPLLWVIYTVYFSINIFYLLFS